MQSRRHSMLEAIANNVIGFGIGLLAQMTVFPIFGIKADWRQNMGVALSFTVTSLVRSYALRRMFNWWRS